MAYAASPAQVKIRVKLPFDSTSPSAVVLPVGTVVTVLWAQEDKLMVRYRRVEGLVPAVTINYVPSAHPGDIREFRPEPEVKDSAVPVVRNERSSNEYHAQTSKATGSDAALGSFFTNKVMIGAGAVVVVLMLASLAGKNNDTERLQLRRRS